MPETKEKKEDWLIWSEFECINAKKDPENKKQFSVEADYVHSSQIFSPPLSEHNKKALV